MVWLGSTAGQVISWSDTQVVATVASGSLTGIARIQQSDEWSNAFGFWVMPPGSNPVAQITSRLHPVPARYAATQMQRRRSLLPLGNAAGSHASPRFTLRRDQVPGGNTMTLQPSLLNMSVGDTATIQALGPNGQSVTGLTWTSSDANVVSLSTDDPPLLTALAAGHVTVTAGTASADVTVWSSRDSNQLHSFQRRRIRPRLRGSSRDSNQLHSFQRRRIRPRLRKRADVGIERSNHREPFDQ